MAEQRKKLRLGELLVQQGLISQDQLRIALMEQTEHDMPLGRQLVRLGFVTEAMIRDILAHTIGQEGIDLSNVVADAEALRPGAGRVCAPLPSAADRLQPGTQRTCWWR